MSRICQVCAKTSILTTVRKKLRGKYNPTTKQRKHPNLQWKVINGVRIKICMQCVRTSKKQKVVKKVKTRVAVSQNSKTSPTSKVKKTKK